jgi:hypothetical protein
LKTCLLIVIALAARAAFAEGNNGVPDQFSILTPEEVQVDVALHGYGGSYEGDEYTGVILEPVLIKCLNGSPGYYYVFVYDGSDESNKKAMEGIIKHFNDDRGFYWEDISPLVNVVRNNSKEYSTFTYSAWDFGECRSKCTGIDSLLYEFDIYVEILYKHFSLNEGPRIRLYTDSPFRSRVIFAVEDNGCERYLWPEGYSGWVLGENSRVKSYVGFMEPTREEIENCYEEKLGELSSAIRDEGGLFEENVSRWGHTRDKVGLLEKAEGYHRIQVPEPE